MRWRAQPTSVLLTTDCHKRSLELFISHSHWDSDLNKVYSFVTTKSRCLSHNFPGVSPAHFGPALLQHTATNPTLRTSNTRSNQISTPSTQPRRPLLSHSPSSELQHQNDAENHDEVGDGRTNTARDEPRLEI